MAADFRFGDMICYRYYMYGPHDGPIMYVGNCAHYRRDGGGPGLIDMIAIPEGRLDHKDPEMWQLCMHLADKDGWQTIYEPGDPGFGRDYAEVPDGSSITITYDGMDVTDQVLITELGDGSFSFDPPIRAGATISVRYE